MKESTALRQVWVRYNGERDPKEFGKPLPPREALRKVDELQASPRVAEAWHEKVKE